MTRSSHRAHRRRSRRRAIALAMLVGFGAFAVITASAASLGGVTSGDLGTDMVAVSSCDTDGVTLSYTNTYQGSVGRYQTTAVGVSGINTACNGKAISVTLRDVGNVGLASGTATVAAGAASITMSGIGANASAVTGAAIVITG